MIIDIIKPCGFCKGVQGAIKKAIEIKDSTNFERYFTYGSLVHNDNVVKMLEDKGISIVKTDVSSLSKLTNKDCVIFTAHGTNLNAVNYLIENNITYFETVCPFVRRNMDLVINNNEVIYIGYMNHPETIAIMSLNKNIVLYDMNVGFINKLDLVNPIVVTQTTISILDIDKVFNEVKENYPNAVLMNGVCKETYNRQKAILDLDKTYDLIIVVGSTSSSNTDRLYRLALNKCKNTIKINDVSELDNNLLKGVNSCLLVAGASTSFDDVNDIKEYLENGRI